MNAPRDLVFRAYTERAQVDAWYGPKGFTTTTFEMDVRVGGRWRYQMEHAEYGVFTDRVVFLEVDRPSKLVYEHGNDIDDDPERFTVTVTFVEHEGKTTVRMRHVFPTLEALERAKEHNAVEGGKQTLEKLEAHLARGNAL